MSISIRTHYTVLLKMYDQFVFKPINAHSGEEQPVNLGEMFNPYAAGG